MNTKDYIIENNKLKQQIISYENQMNDLQILYKEKLTRLQNEKDKLMSQPMPMFKSPSHTYDNDMDNYNSDDSFELNKKHERSTSNSVPFKLRERSISNSSGIYGIYCNEEQLEHTVESKTQSEIGMCDKEMYNELMGKFNELNDVIKNEMGNKQLKERYELLLEKYNGLCKGHRELIGRLNEENELRDMKWMGIVNAMNERLKEKTNELEGYKMKCENVLNEIRSGVKEKQLECKGILNGLVMEINEILVGVKCEEDGIREFKLVKENEIERLNEEIEAYKVRLNEYEMVSEMKLQLNEQGNVLKCIKESVCDNNEMIKNEMGNKQLKERYELLLEKYNGLCKGHRELIGRLNEENELRDMKWMGIVNGMNERLKEKTNELEGYKMKCENVLNEIRSGVKEKQLECKVILNGLVMEINEILVGVKCEEDGIREFKLVKENEIERLNEEIEGYKVRLSEYEMVSEMKLQMNEQGNVLKCIKESVCDDNERNVLENKINNIENSLKVCVGVMKSTENKMENVCKRESISEIQSVLECIEQHMKSDTLENKINEIENRLKICANTMESTQNESLKNNVIELQSQLKDLNENNLNNIKEIMDSNFKRIEGCIDIKWTENKMNEMENSLKTCINLMENINDSLKNNIFEIQSQLKDEQKILEYIKQNIISGNMKSDTMQNKMDEIGNNLKINNSLKDNVLEYIKQNVSNNNKKNETLQSEINGMDNRVGKCIDIMKLLGDNISEIQLELCKQQNVLINIEQNVSDSNNKYDEHQNILKDTINKTNNLRNEINVIKYDNNDMEKVYNLYETMSEQIERIQLLYTETKEEEKDISDTDNGSEDNNIDEQKEQLIQIQTMQNIIERLKGCLSQMHDQNIIIMTEQKMEYDNLDKIYTNYQMACNRNMRQLTKDVYDVEYKKFNGYKDIVTEMIGNAGIYTKDAITNYLCTP